VDPLDEFKIIDGISTQSWVERHREFLERLYIVSKINAWNIVDDVE
jgi:hypothetical protein